MNTELNYEIFDRQLHTLIDMSHLLVNAWDDYSTTELTLDLKSLSVKASRLCYMTDADWSLQQHEVVHLRQQQNNEFLARLELLVKECLCPCVEKTLIQIRENKIFEGKKWPSFPTNLSEVMPHLSEMLRNEGVTIAQWDSLLDSTRIVEKALKTKVKQVSFPGMDYRQKTWMLCEYFALMCYLLYHFQRVSALCKDEETEEGAGLKLEQFIQDYVNSEAGSQELARYWQVLVFQNDGQQPSEEMLKTARKNLLQEVPLHLQLCFTQHIQQLNKLALALRQQKLVPSDYWTFISVVAKWQLLTQKLEMIRHPEKFEPILNNKVFHTLVHNVPIDLADLRSRIERMLPLIRHKNEWFCVWCVLYHFNLLATKNFEAFAQQMMHPDWFGRTPGALSFSGDTLREYTGYFTEVHYPVWNEKQYLIYKELHGKKKWSDSLCSKFLRLCTELEYIYKGTSLLSGEILHLAD